MREWVGGRIGGVSQVVDFFSASKWEALSSSPSTAKKKKERENM
jgi:hypothetical protein